ncbi:hypothetical protein RclHR1_00670009 [Rhizophagus clarus]|uniref:F-box domain-containing protein n=1 Tax=Rhizophagus clarus TaxID=94130 RepID=A0A2Z6SJ96_9GLOM|nr:hypothetical protein RclHR1_00670009 [Rhizophagus clarus]
MSQLPADCLNDIFEFLKDDIKTLYSCMLVNHLWYININNYISNELIDLISIQKNLKYVNITSKLIDTFPSLITTNLPNTLFKLKLCSTNFVSLLFIIKFTNLQELELSFDYEENFGDFERLKFAIFPKLQILKIKRALPESGLLIKFLENNGKYLKELHLSEFDGYWGDNSLNLSIAKFCTNLKKLTTGFRYKELETLKIVFNSCKYLESIKMWCGGFLLSEKEALKAVVKYSHENFSELIIYHVFTTQSRLFPEELESFFISWTSRVPLKSISLIVTTNHFYETSLDKYDENMEVIRKYIQLGVIEKFEVRDLNDDEYD